MPRKLGQHFLVNQSILERIADAARGSQSEGAYERLVEIGPGRGALTRHLLSRTSELHCIEIDAELVAFLRREFATATNLHLHHADVLTIDLAQWGPATIVGNLPYYISSPIIQRFLALDGRFPCAVFLLQLEVANRLLAMPGTREYGYLTVASRLACDVELVCTAPPGAFKPPPKVDSAAVRLVRVDRRVADTQAVLTLASHAFAHKRKTLRNNLRPFYGPVVDGIPEAGKRAEELTIEQFIALAESFSRL